MKDYYYDTDRKRKSSHFKNYFIINILVLIFAGTAAVVACIAKNHAGFWVDYATNLLSMFTVIMLILCAGATVYKLRTYFKPRPDEGKKPNENKKVSKV